MRGVFPFEMSVYIIYSLLSCSRSLMKWTKIDVSFRAFEHTHTKNWHFEYMHTVRSSYNQSMQISSSFVNFPSTVILSEPKKCVDLALKRRTSRKSSLNVFFPPPPSMTVCKDPPYKVEESGYAGFILPIEVYFRNKVIK